MEAEVPLKIKKHTNFKGFGTIYCVVCCNAGRVISADKMKKVFESQKIERLELDPKHNTDDSTTFKIVRNRIVPQLTI